MISTSLQWLNYNELILTYLTSFAFIIDQLFINSILTYARTHLSASLTPLIRFRENLMMLS